MTDKNDSIDSREDLHKKLQEDVDNCDWNLLDPHHKRQALFIIDDGIDLVEVGASMAIDDVDKVRTWMADQKLSRPTDELVESWSNDLHQRFEFLIIQPYVLIKLIRKEQ